MTLGAARMSHEAARTVRASFEGHDRLQRSVEGTYVAWSPAGRLCVPPLRRAAEPVPGRHSGSFRAHHPSQPPLREPGYRLGTYRPRDTGRCAVLLEQGEHRAEVWPAWSSGWCAAGPAGRQKHADCAGEWSAGVRSQHMKLHAPVLLMITSATSAPLGFCPTPVPVSGAARLGRGGVQVWPANPQLTDLLPATCSGPRRGAGALLSSAVSWAHARGTDWGFWSAMVHTPAPAAESTCSAPGAGQSMTLARCHAFH